MMNTPLRKYDLLYKTIDDATNKQFPLDILDIIHGYSGLNRTQLSNDVVTLHTSLVQSRNTLSESKGKHIFSKKANSYLKEIELVNKNHDYGKTRALMLTCKLYELLIDMKYIYSHYMVFMSILKNKTKSLYYNQNKPYLNFAHYYRILFNEELEVTQHIRDYIVFNQRHINNPLTRYKVQHNLCSICKQPGHNKHSCERWNLIPSTLY